MIELPALEYLMGCYFHEDYADVHGSARGAIDDFVQADRAQAEKVNAEITVLLAERDTEAEIAETLWEYGLTFYPLAKGWPTHRDWLLDVAEQIDHLLTEGHSPS